MMGQFRVLVAAAEKFDLVHRGTDPKPEPALPADPGIVHAVGRGLRPTTNEIDRRNEYGLCGQPVKVIYPLLFDTSDEDSCPDCIELAPTAIRQPAL